MLEIAIMIEGQNGLNWERWKKMVLSVEYLGFVGLYRSDHFTNIKSAQYVCPRASSWR
jgi:hypothetical protein